MQKNGDIYVECQLTVSVKVNHKRLFAHESGGFKNHYLLDRYSKSKGPLALPWSIIVFKFLVLDLIENTVIIGLWSFNWPFG